MSETRAEYGVSGLDKGPNPATLLPFSEPGYIEPSELDLRAVMQRFGLTGAQVASLTGVLPRTVRKWLAPPEASSHVQMPYAAWRLLLVAAGMVTPETVADLARRPARGQQEGMRIEFENDARFITAFNPDGSVKIRCDFAYTDCSEVEPLDKFVMRHGGPEGTAQYLAERYSERTNP